MTPVRLEPAALPSRVKRSTTEPLRSLGIRLVICKSDFTDITQNIEHLECPTKLTSDAKIVLAVVALFGDTIHKVNEKMENNAKLDQTAHLSNSI